MSSGAMQYNHEWDDKTRREVEHLNEVIQSRDSSLIQKQIAQAKIQQLGMSKGPPPHTRKHRATGASGIELDNGSDTKTNHLFRNDEAFEKFEMGADNHPSSHDSRRAGSRHDQAVSDFQSVRMNHNARGTAKERAEEKVIEGFEEALHYDKKNM